MRVVSIDPAIRNTGYAVLEGDYRSPRALAYGTLSLPAKLPQSACLRAIHEHVCALIREYGGFDAFAYCCAKKYSPHVKANHLLHLTKVPMPMLMQ